MVRILTIFLALLQSWLYRFIILVKLTKINLAGVSVLVNEPIPNEKKNKSFLYKLGIVLLLLSLSLWLVPFIIPFTPLPLKLKAGVITGSLVVAEVIFWIGAVLVGKEAAARFKAYLNPAHWRKRGGERKHEE